MVMANDCIKGKVIGCSSIEPVQESNKNQKRKNSNQKRETKEAAQPNKAQMNKLERKQKYKELNQTLK